MNLVSVADSVMRMKRNEDSDSVAGGTAGSSNGEGDSIKVFVRARPPMNDGDHTMCLETDCSRNAVIMLSKPEPKVFTYDNVADMNVTQETVFSTVGRKIIESCVGGYNGTIFAYGQTGSGKTFTMLGPSEDSDNFQHELRGVIPRSFEYLFTLVKREQELHGDKVQFLTKCSFLEIYNEQIFDLLDEASNGLHLRENIRKGVFVDGLIEHAVNNAAEAYDVLSTGWMNRTVASTSMNRESSRSHAVFTLSIESKTLNNGVWTMKASQMNLVDLAGSERQKDTHTTGARLKEAGSINKSLSVLGNVIMSLVDIAHGKTRHVPYRDSKLSFLLRDSLGGNAKTYIIACIHPGAKSFGETLSTLQFARRAKMIKNKAVINEDAQGSVVHLQAEIKRLKEALQQYETGTLPSSVNYSEVVSNDTGECDKSISYWKRCFLQAMHLREKTRHEVQSVQEKNVVVQGKLDKMDKQLRSKDMVLKFRANSLKVYENYKKEQRQLYPDEKDLIISNLKGEICQLEDQVAHHPVLGGYKLENDRLKFEIAQIKTNKKTCEDIDRQRSNELEKIFQEILHDKQKDSGQTPRLATPQESPKISTATMERQKVQVENLQKQLEQMQNDLQLEKEGSEKERIKLKSDLDSWKTRYEEVAAVQKSQCISGQVEREERDRLHMETIRNLTPKKVQYNLRNRTILTGASGLSFSLDDSVAGDDILSEEKPVNMYETLEEELKKAKEENSQLRSKMEEKDNLLVEKSSEISRLMSESTQLSEILEKERTERTYQVKTLIEEKQALTVERNKLVDDIQGLSDQIKELNLIMNVTDKRVLDLKKERDAIKEENQNAFKELSTKVLQLENERVKFMDELQSASQECERLKENEETARASVLFMQDQLTDCEVRLTEKEADISHLRTSYQDAILKISKQEERSSLLETQVQIAGNKAGDKEKELLNVMSMKKEVEIQVEELTDKLVVLQDELKNVHEELMSEKEEVRRLSRAEKEQKEVYQSMCIKLEKQKKMHQEAISTQTALDEQLRESQEREDTLQKKLEEREQSITSLTENVNELNDKVNYLEIEIQRKKAEYDLLQEDLDCAIQESNTTKTDIECLKLQNYQLVKEVEEKEKIHEDFLQENNVKQIEMESLRSTMKQLQSDKEYLEEMKKKAENENKSLCNELTKLQCDSSSQMSSLATTQQELGKKKIKLVETENQLSEYINTIEELKEEVLERDSNINTMQVIISDLETKIEQKQEALEASRKGQETLQADLNNLRSTFQATIDDRNAKAIKLSELEKRLMILEEIERELTQAKTKKAEAETRESEIKEEMELLKSTLHSSISRQEKLEIQANLYEEKFKEENLKVDEAENECNRLRNILEQKSKEVDVAESELNQWKEQCKMAQKRSDELTEEIGKLGSHTNHHQKIKLFEKKTQEHSQMLEEVNHMKRELSRLRALVGEKTPCKGHVHKEKENTPLKDTALNTSHLLQQ